MVELRRKIRSVWKTALVVLSASTLSIACSTSASLVENRLDPVTSVMISYSTTPMVFYRDVAGRAAFARDYVHLAPVEVNRSGQYRYYLWLGIWNTMQAAPPGSTRDGFESIVIFADGEPLPLELTGWTAAAIGASEPVHLKPVASAADAYYGLTAEQLRLIVEASDIRLQSTGSYSGTFEPWDDQARARAALAAFLDASVF